MSEQLEFKVSSGLKDIIGKELITDDFIAIFELVKNAYDAKAKKVWIVFKDVLEEESPKSRIIVIDNGEGMSKTDIIKKWLFVAYSEKRFLEDKDYRNKIDNKRIFAGAKGIGRFSCDRLAKKLILYTKKEDKKEIHKVEINWDKFEEDLEKLFQNIEVTYKQLHELDIDNFNFNEIDEKEYKKGTILELENLRSSWNKEKILRLKQHLQRLINPIQVGNEQEFSIYIVANEFKDDDKKILEKNINEPYKIVNGLIKNIIFEELEIKTVQISCDISESGDGINTKLIDKNKLIFEINEKNLVYGNLKNIKIKIFYLNKSAKTTFTKIMGLRPVKYGSIFLYKNGFRIHPYGNEGDDWLGLDRRKLQGYRRKIANRELFGRIELWGNQPAFREVSSRDGGVIKTQEFEELQTFFKKYVLERLERYVVEGIAWDNPSSKKLSKNLEDINKDSLKIINKIIGDSPDENIQIRFNENLLNIYNERKNEILPEILKNLEYIKNNFKTPEEKEYVNLQIKSVKNAFVNMMSKQIELEKQVEIVEKESLFSKYKKEEDRTEIMGLQHQIGISSDNMKGVILEMKLLFADENYVLPPDKLKNYLNALLIQIESISNIAEYITLAKFELESRKIKEDLIKFVNDYIDRIYKIYNVKNIENKKINISVNKNNLSYNINFNPFQFTVIIDNLIGNSIKAKAKNIYFDFLITDDGDLLIKVKDDGIGIPLENFDKIFNFGFSTTKGTGIGLSQIRKILEGWGEIDINKTYKKGAEFIIKVNKK